MLGTSGSFTLVCLSYSQNFYTLFHCPLLLISEKVHSLGRTRFLCCGLKQTFTHRDSPKTFVEQTNECCGNSPNNSLFLLFKFIKYSFVIPYIFITTT